MAPSTFAAAAVRLEPQTVRHASEMFIILSDPAIYEFEGSPPKSEASLAERFAGLESRVSPDARQQWLNWVIRLPSGELAGYVQATIGSDRTAHIAYELASRFWRQRIGSTAVSRMLEELELTYGVCAFVATVKEQNHRSLALLRSLGFERRGLNEPGEVILHKGAVPAGCAKR